MDRTLIVAIGSGLVLAVAAWKWKQHRLAPETRAVESALVASVPVSSAPGGRPRASCRARELRLRLPIAGSFGKNWLIANFFDTEVASSQIRDYMGSNGSEAITYDGHSGVDFELPSFRAMDEGVPVLAAAEGLVEAVYDQDSDRNRTCVQGKSNEVRIRHANGFATVYMHLRRNSALVRPGDHVSPGQRLALVGSSGCSSYPHLHFETLDCQDQAFDMVPAQLFETPLVYPRQARPSVMETYVFQPNIRDVLAIQEPESADRHQVAVGQYFSIAATIANLQAGDRVRFDFLTPNNTLWEHSFETRAERFFTRSHWWSDFELPRAGAWVARVSVNGQILVERSLQASEPRNY